MALQSALVDVNYVGNGVDSVFDVDFSQKLLQRGILEARSRLAVTASTK